MSHLLYSASQSRQIDQAAIHDFHIPGALLMQRAGFLLFRSIPDHCHNISIFIGSGNNGGDGLVAAFFAVQYGLDVQVVHARGLDNLQGDAAHMRDHALALGVTFVPFDQDFVIPSSTEVVIDALLGTGLDREVTGVYAEMISCINRSNSYVLAADIPSGLCADTGTVLGTAVRAHRTCTFVCTKKGMVTADAADYCGEILLDTLNIPEAAYQGVQACAQKLAINTMRNALKPRAYNTHKGSFGTLVVIAGDRGMSGAAQLNSLAALAIGAGKVHLLTHPAHSDIVGPPNPEIMCHGCQTEEEVRYFCDQASTVLIGSGMSNQSEWSQRMFAIAASLPQPVVGDAGFLDYLATVQSATAAGSLIITPHPGEATRLLQGAGVEAPHDRFQIAAALSSHYHSYTVLKGCGSIIHSPESNTLPQVCCYGNPALASAGTGDVLAGMIAGLSAQGYNPMLAASMGVTFHAWVADQLVKDHHHFHLFASDLIRHMNFIHQKADSEC